MKNKKNLILIISSIIIVVLLAAGLVYYFNKDNVPKYSSKLTELTIEEYKEIISSKEDKNTIIILSAQTTNLSEDYVKMINEVVPTTKLDFYYLNTSKLIYNSDDYKAVWNVAETNISPTILIVNKGKKVATLVGNVTKTELEEFIKNYK